MSEPQAAEANPIRASTSLQGVGDLLIYLGGQIIRETRLRPAGLVDHVAGKDHHPGNLEAGFDPLFLVRVQVHHGEEEPGVAPGGGQIAISLTGPPAGLSVPLDGVAYLTPDQGGFAQGGLKPIQLPRISGYPGQFLEALLRDPICQGHGLLLIM